MYTVQVTQAFREINALLMSLLLHIFCLISPMKESGDKIDLLKALETKVAIVQGKGTKSKSVLTVIEVSDFL